MSRNLNQLQRQANAMGGSLRVVGGQLGTLSNQASSAGQSLGGGMGLKGQAIGVAGVLGTTLLPAIGALSPMLFGFAAVGGAAALAMGDLKKEAKKLKPEYEALQKVASKAVMPGVKRAMDDVKGAMKGLQPVIKIGGEAFGTFVERAAKFANSPAFQSSLLKNVEMGSKFFGDMTGSVLDFTQAFLDFGTKSQPTLDAFQNLFGGVLDTGLPDMFKELEQGIGGSADFIDGLAGFLNGSLLPAIGKIAGAWAETFGPHAEQVLRTLGGAVEGFAMIFSGAMEGLQPLASVFTDGLRALNDVGAIAFSVLGDLAGLLGGALLGALTDVSGGDALGGLTDQFRGFSNWVQENQTGIRLAFTMIAIGIIDMTSAGLEMLPLLSGGFKTFAEMAITALGALLAVLATTFADVPVIGDKFKGLLTDFTEVSGGWLSNLDTMQNGITDFAAAAEPRLSRAKLTLSVEQAQTNLASIKRQLLDPELTKERKAELTAQKDVAERILAAARKQLKEFDNEEAEAKLSADPSAFFGTVNSVNGTRLAGKSVRVAANTAAFYSAVGGISGRVLGTSYINVKYRQAEASLQKPFKSANGGRVPGYASGGDVQFAPDGLLSGPGTGRSDDILAMFASGAVGRVSTTEYVVNAASTKKYLPLLEAINQNKLPGFASGGLTSGQLKGLSAPSDVAGLKGTLGEVRTRIKEKTAGRTESRLLNVLDAVGKKLVVHERALTSVNASLSKAKDKLNSLTTASAQMATSVKAGILSASNITRGTSGGGLTTVRSIMGGLTASRDKASALSGALSGLRGKGLSASLLQQIADAGIEGGGLETAGALMSASSSEIGSINNLQSQINASATSAGRTTADHMYATAIKQQTVSVNKLQASQDRLERTMAALAKSLDKTLGKAIGKKSAGGIVGAAASGGIRGGLTWVGEQEPELLDLPVGSRVWSGPDSRRKAREMSAPWASMLNTPRRGPVASASAASGRPEPVVVELRSSGSEVDEFLLLMLRRAINNRGGNAQFVLTGRRQP
ncbi:hypothetical protein ACKI10_17250 [Streptomyces galilaeus]|uniref:hypothetical protein n=1 Tax=Streptomyces TaxID=1883 RepID=UPI0034DFF770